MEHHQYSDGLGPGLRRDETGRLFQVGVADGAPIPLRKQEIMRNLSIRRKRITTPAEKRMCIALQAFVRKSGGVIRFQRERTVHIADILSRSFDFYFAQGKIAIEIDGKSHGAAIQKAKDEWTDRIVAEQCGIKVLRFSNQRVLGDARSVVQEIAAEICARHGWPSHIRERIRAAAI